MEEISEQEALQSLVRSDLSSFIQKTFSTVDPGASYLHNWHIDLIAEYLLAVERREIKRLIINIPPGYLKSISVNVAWPAWLLGHNPSERIMCASYAQAISTKHSIDCRLVMKSNWYRSAFPETIIGKDENTPDQQHLYVTTERGQRFATSFGGAATGEGCNVLIIDDPHNVKEAVSDKERKSSIEEFDQTFMSRLRDKKNGVVVIIMQRLHDNDLTGHLLENKGSYTHLCIPAKAEERTLIHFGDVELVREVGDVLHPEREDKEQIEQVEIDLGSMAFASQYQQSPTPAEGGIFKKPWLEDNKYTKRADAYDMIVQSWDTAVKTEDSNDPSVCTTWGIRGGDVDLLHVKRERMDYPDLKRAVVNMAIEWNPNAILIEDKSSGQSLIQDLRKEASTSSLPIIAIMPHKDKVTRANVVTPTYEAGKVHHPKEAGWIAAFEKEMLNFPLANHDDQVDSTTQFLSWWKDRQLVRIRRT